MSLWLNKTTKKKAGWVVCFSLFVVICSFLIISFTTKYYQLAEKNFSTFVTKKISNGNLESKNVFANLDHDDYQETYKLLNGQFVISENSETLWVSPDIWWVNDFLLADSTNDGEVNINISLWKAGDFGESTPFWVKANDMSVKNHLFVYRLDDNELKIIWGSSNLEAPNCQLDFTDIDYDQKIELITMEGSYGYEPNCVGEYVAIWRWNEWGFENVWRSSKGKFDDLNLEIKNIPFPNN